MSEKGTPKALEYTKDIVVSRLSNTNMSISKETGEYTAEFFEAIYNKIVELENRESN